MLSYLFRLINEFEREHGIHPNLLYLNEEHAQFLKEALADGHDANSIAQLLRMEFIISRETVHPHVVWTQTAARLAS